MNKKLIFIGIILAFFVMGFLSMQRAVPGGKEDRIYNEIRLYSPYKLEKYIGGLTIVDSRNGVKEKPSAAEVFWRLDELDKAWGKTHLAVKGDTVDVLGDNNQSVVKIHIESEKEKKFVKSFYGI